MTTHDEEQHLAKQVEEYFTRGLGTRSRWALRAALDAAETEGIAGVLVVQISAKNKDFPEISFTVGDVELISRWAM